MRGSRTEQAGTGRRMEKPAVFMLQQAVPGSILRKSRYTEITDCVPARPQEPVFTALDGIFRLMHKYLPLTYFRGFNGA